MMYRQSEALVSFMQRITTTVSSNKLPNLLQVTISAIVIFKVFLNLSAIYRITISLNGTFV